ncbi:autophagy-related protein 22-like protein [Mycena leptocephala]|nr:autophagy-related protein 22-like protein [Mycena leptocephala]
MSRLPAPENPVLDAEPVAESRHSDEYKDKGSSDQPSTPPVASKHPLFVSSIGKNEPAVTRRELWSYYHNGDNGVGPNGYSMTLFQSLAFAAGYDPVAGVGSSCSSDSSSGQCVLPWGGGTKSVTSVVLIANGVSFAIMTMIFTTIGSAADYGTFGRWLLLIITVICWGAQFASMALTEPSRWGAAMALYMIGFISYGATLVFYAALFPRLARNTPHAKEIREKYEAGETSKEDYEREESLEKNRISNISTVNNYTIVLTNMYWVITGIWWFIFQQPRPGPPLPKGERYITIGWKQIWAACKQYKQLPYTFIYLFSFFLLADGLNTTGTLVSICQNDKFSFSFLQHSSTISTFGFWYIQRYWKIPTKTMFVVTNVVTIMIPLWGMIGIWTLKLGFHNKWEFWAYNIVFGLFQAPYYAFSQTMMAELTPPGFDNMFFGLFGLSNRASSMIGPNVIQAIIDSSGNNWMGFPFLFALCTSASLVIWFAVDIPKGRSDAVAWAEGIRAAKYAEDGLVLKE